MLWEGHLGDPGEAPIPRAAIQRRGAAAKTQKCTSKVYDDRA